MKPPTACPPLFRAAAVAAGLAGSGLALAAQWTLAPSGTLSTRVEQNPRLSPAEDQEDELSTGAGAQAAFNLRRRTERLDVSLRPVFGTYRYPDDSNLDRNEIHVDSALSWLGETISWSGEAAASRDTTLTSELGGTGLTQSNFRHESYNVSLGPVWQMNERTQIAPSLGLQAHRYPGRESSALEDYRYSTASLATSYVFDERTTLSLSGNVSRLRNSGSGTGSDNSGVTLQARYAWSPVWMLSAAAGPSWVKRGPVSNQGLLYSVDVSRTFERASLSLNASRRQSPVGSATLTEVEEASLALNTQVSERLSASVTASVTRRRNALRDFDLDLQRVRYSRINAELSWRVGPNWQLVTSVGHAIQEVGSSFFEGSTGRGYNALLALSWTGDGYVD